MAAGLRTLARLGCVRRMGMTCVSQRSPHRHIHAGEPMVTVCKLMGPADSNMLGSIHGGHILQMIEDAGTVITMRYCNHAPNRDRSAAPYRTALARVERTDFLQRMAVGELAELEARITFTSPRSLEVHVSVWAERMAQGEARRLTNEARLWYVPVTPPDVHKPASVPPMSHPDPTAELAARGRYERQKTERHLQAMQGISTDLLPAQLFNSPPLHTMASSRSMLAHLVGPMDCIPCEAHAHWVRGGVVMKLMDEAAAIAACRHCHSHVVTISMDATNFHRKVALGSLLNVTGTVVYCSNKSMEVEVLVDVEAPFSSREPRSFRAVEALFTFVSLGKNREVLPVKPLQINTDEERTIFEGGQQRYEAKKKRRENKKS